MKKITTLLLSCMTFLSTSALIAQSKYSSYPQGSGYSSYQQGGGYSSYPQGSSYSSMPSSSNYSSSNYSSSSYSSSSYASSQINWLSNYSEAVSQAQSTSKPIIILFTGTNWCPACMKLERSVLNQPEFAQAIGQKFVFLKAEFPDYSETAVMNSPYKPLLDRYGVNAFPTFIVVNASGQTLATVNYREGGPQGYIQELQNISQSSSSFPSSTSTYYR